MIEEEKEQTKPDTKINLITGVLLLIFVAILILGLTIYINPPERERKDTRYLDIDNASLIYAKIIGYGINVTFDEGKYQKCFKEWDWENDVTLFRCEYFGELNSNNREKVLLKFWCSPSGDCQIYPRIFRGNMTKLF
ncbi:MAG: hypothetical protein AABY22_05835 [Nanoarchaeota archaeon]